MANEDKNLEEINSLLLSLSQTQESTTLEEQLRRLGYLFGELDDCPKKYISSVINAIDRSYVVLTHILSSDPNNKFLLIQVSSLLLNKALTLCRIDCYKDAHEAIDEAIRIDPCPLFYWNKALMFHDKGKLQKSYEQYLLALESNKIKRYRVATRDIPYLNEMTQVALKMGKYELARTHIETALTQDKKQHEPELFTTAFEVYYKLGDMENFYKYAALSLKFAFATIAEFKKHKLIKSCINDPKLEQIIMHFQNKASMKYSLGSDRLSNDIELAWHFVMQNLLSHKRTPVIALTKLDATIPEVILLNYWQEHRFLINQIGHPMAFLSKHIMRLFDINKIDAPKSHKYIKAQIQLRLDEGYRFFDQVFENFEDALALFNNKFSSTIKVDNISTKYIQLIPVSSWQLYQPKSLKLIDTQKSLTVQMDINHYVLQVTGVENFREEYWGNLYDMTARMHMLIKKYLKLGFTARVITE